MTIDAHQHFWRYSAAEYGWIDESMRAIRRDFLPADLHSEFKAVGIDGCVAVQARQTVAETNWLLQLATEHRFIKGVVGWVPLAELGAGVGWLLDELAANPRLRGVRHVLQGEPDDYFARPEFNAGLRAVAARGLTYDLLVFARQLVPALELIDRHPNLRIVVDHIAKPVVQGSPPAAWRAQMRELAKRPHVMCKFSGVVTEVPGWKWTPELLRPYFDVVLEAFGPPRLMFGSDWPVCTVAASYGQWHGFVQECIAPLNPAERAAIMGGTATAFYFLQN